MRNVTTLAVVPAAVGAVVAIWLTGCGATSRYDAATVARLKAQFQGTAVVVMPFPPKAGLDDPDGLAHTARLATQRYLAEKGIFAAVVREPQNASGAARTVVVEAVLNDFRIVSGAARFWGGALAGSSYMTFDVTLREGPGGAVIVSEEIGSNNNAVAAAWAGGSSDRSLPTDMGGIIGEWVIQTLEKR